MMPVAQAKEVEPVPRVLLDIDEPVTRLTLKAILEAEGHLVVSERPEAVITDTPAKAVRYAAVAPSLVLASPGMVRAAVESMREGVYGYIFTPFIPGEAGLMLERALRPGKPPAAPSPQESLAENEARLIRETLRQCRGNHTEAARLLGIARNTLWRKVKKLNAEKT